ncbi:hypothetical protein D3C76_443880 [compost metagenome]
MRSLMFFSDLKNERPFVAHLKTARPGGFCGWLSGSHSLLRNGLLLLNYPSDALAPVIKAIYSTQSARSALRHPGQAFQQDGEARCI